MVNRNSIHNESMNRRFNNIMSNRRWTQRERDMYDRGHAVGASRSTNNKVRELRELISERFDDVRFTEHDRPNQDWDEALDILRLLL